MEALIQIALLFFFIHFLVVTSVMTAALLLARPEYPVLGREPGHLALKRSFRFVAQLPGQALRSALRVLHWVPFLHSAQ